MGVFEFHGRADVAGVEGFDGVALGTIDGEQLADAFGAAAGGVGEFGAGGHVAAVNPEEREIAHVGFVHGFEDEGNGFRVIEGDADGVAGRVGGIDGGAVHRGGAVLGDEVHEAGDADILEGGGAEKRGEDVFLDGFVDVGAQFVLAEGVVVGEVLVEQGVVGFGDILDELAVEGLDLFAVFALGGGFGEFAAGVVGVGDDLAAHDVEDAAEAGAGVERDGHGKDTGPEMFAGISEDLVEAGVFLVEHVDDEEARDAVVGGGFPDPVGADLDTMGGIGDDEGEISDAEGAEGFGDEVIVARAVDDVEFFPQPLGAKHGGMDGYLVGLFVGVEVGDGGAGFDAADAADMPGAGEHGFAEDGLAAGGVAGDGEVADVGSVVILHGVGSRLGGKRGERSAARPQRGGR